MKIGIRLPHHLEPSGQALRRFSVRAEELGFDSLWTNDHILVPIEHYSRHGRMLESITTLAYIAAVTATITVGTSVLLLPLREPILTAKQLSTLDRLCGGRLIVGVGVGWLEEEFHLLEKDFRRRGRILEEQIELLRVIWGGSVISHKCQFCNVVGVRLGPAPHVPGGPPLWIGGSSETAAKRALRLKCPWHPNHLSPAEIDEMRDQLTDSGSTKTLRISAHNRAVLGSGDTENDVDHARVVAGSSGRILNTLEAYANAGVEHMVLSIDGLGVSSEQIEWFASTILDEAHKL